VDWAVSAGSSLESALGEALASVRARGGHGGAIVLGGDGRFAVAFDTSAMARGWRDASTSVVPPVRRQL
jgi:isoaspartyl peptidase/L-asparaginase-like protein (Ntn-hydrolase superfamily)